MVDFTTEYLSVAAASTSVAIIVTNDPLGDNPIVFVNTAFTALTGYSFQDAVGRNCRFLQGTATEPLRVKEIQQAIARGRPVRCELLNYRKNGTSFWNNITIDPIHDEVGRLIGFVSMHHDCGNKYTEIGARKDSQHLLTAIANSIPGYIYQRVMLPSGEITYPYVSRSVLRILGIPVDTDEAVEPVLRRLHAHDQSRFTRLIVESGKNLTPFAAEYRLVSLSGRDHWFRSESFPRKEVDGSIIWDGLAIEITSEKKSEEKIAHLSHHDTLTGVGNRLLFNTTLARAMSTASDKTSEMGVFSIDLDDFQALNTTRGGQVADKVLRAVGGRLRDFAEPLGGLVARIGGDEFGIILPWVQTDGSAMDFAEAICSEIRRPLAIDGENLIVEACVGAAILPHDGDATQAAPPQEWGTELLNRANLALHAAKRDGSGASRVYSGDLDERVRVGPELKRSLKQALAEEQFTLHYQPIVNLASGEVVAAEALLRWEHPKLGLQRPDLFIPIAEATGLIVPLGAWVVKTAMRQAEEWKRQGLKPIRIAINVSSIQLQQPGFLAMVQQALTETGADARQFEFELTEGVLLRASLEVKALFEALRNMGFGLVIDDFGTGHATLAYLRSYAVDKLKIDQVFVRHLVVDSSDAAIIQAVVKLCDRLHLQVVAEGVETVLQRDFLIKEGCTFGQGYLFSMPLRAEDFGWMLQGGRTLPLQSAQM